MPSPSGPVEDRNEQILRCQAIDLLDYLCKEYGSQTVQGWIEQPDTAPAFAEQEGIPALIEAYGPERLLIWIGYFTYRDRRN